MNIRKALPAETPIHPPRKRWHAAFRPEVVFLVLYLTLSIVAIVSVPAGGGCDEGGHIARIDQIAGGGILPVPIDDDDRNRLEFFDDNGSTDVLYGGEVDRALITVAQSNQGFFYNNEMNCTFPVWEGEEITSGLVYGESMLLYPFSNTSVNSPFVYLPQVAFFLIARLFTNSAYALILAMRFGGALALGLVIFLCIKHAPVGKYLMLAIGSMPQTIFATSMVSADTMTLAVCYALVSSFLALLYSKPTDPHSKCALAVFLGSMLVLGICKLSYYPLMLLLGVLPLVRAEWRYRDYYLRTGLAALGSIVLFGLWYAQINGINTGALYYDYVNPDEQLHFVLAHPLFFCGLVLKLLASFNVFGFGDYVLLDVYEPLHDSGWITAAMFMIALVLEVLHIAKKPASLSRKHRLIFVGCLLAIFLATFVLIALALYLQFSAVGAHEIDGVQPRYLLPIHIVLLLALLYACLASRIPHAHRITDGKTDADLDTAIAACPLPLSVAATLSTLLAIANCLYIIYL